MGSVRPSRAVAFGLALAIVGSSAACTMTGDVLDTNAGTGTGDGSSESGASTGGLTIACGGEAVGWWCPAPESSWQVQRVGPLDQTVDANLYDVPMFATEAVTIATLHAQERSVICWFSAGITTWSDPDRNDVLPATSEDIVPGQPERWLDHSSPIVRDAIAARLDQAAGLGCDAVEPGDLHGYTSDSGLPLTRAGTVDYVEWMAAQAHERGLAIALSNANELAVDLEPVVDLAIDYGCLAAGTCDALEGFGQSGKLVLHAEIVEVAMISDVELLVPEVCGESEARSLVTIFKKSELNSWLRPCD